MEQVSMEDLTACLQDTNLELYFDSMCRSMQFRHVKTVKYNGIQALRYSQI